MIRLLRRSFVLKTKKNLCKYLKNNQHLYIQDIIETNSEDKSSLKKELEVLDFNWDQKKYKRYKLIENIYCYKNPSQKYFLDDMISKFKAIFLELSFSKIDFLFEVKNKWIQKKFITKEFQESYSELRKYILSSSEISVFRVDIEDINSIFKLSYFNNRFIASNPPIIFSSNDDSFIGYLCQYGNIHIYTTNLSNTKKTQKVFLSQGF